MNTFLPHGNVFFFLSCRSDPSNSSFPSGKSLKTKERKVKQDDLFPSCFHCWLFDIRWKCSNKDKERMHTAECAGAQHSSRNIIRTIELDVIWPQAKVPLGVLCKSCYIYTAAILLLLHLLLLLLQGRRWYYSYSRGRRWITFTHSVRRALIATLLLAECGWLKIPCRSSAGCWSAVPLKCRNPSFEDLLILLRLTIRLIDLDKTTGAKMKSLSGQTEREPSPSVETYWVVDVFGQNDKVKVSARALRFLSSSSSAIVLRSASEAYSLNCDEARLAREEETILLYTISSIRHEPALVLFPLIKAGTRGDDRAVEWNDCYVIFP